MTENSQSDKEQRTAPTAKQRVLKRFPKAACIEASGCTFAVFSCGVIDSATMLGENGVIQVAIHGDMT